MLVKTLNALGFADPKNHKICRVVAFNPGLSEQRRTEQFLILLGHLFYFTEELFMLLHTKQYHQLNPCDILIIYIHCTRYE